jgi:hypothetical protein
LRWLGVNVGRWLTTSVDKAEASGKRASLRTKLFESLV